MTDEAGLHTCFGSKEEPKSRVLNVRKDKKKKRRRRNRAQMSRHLSVFDSEQHKEVVLVAVFSIKYQTHAP